MADHKISVELELKDLVTAGLRLIRQDIAKLHQNLGNIPQRGLTELTENATKASGAIKTLGGNVQATAGQTTSLNTALVGISASLVALKTIDAFKVALSSSIAFERQMDIVQSVTFATEQQMAALTAQAETLGASTQFTATQAAEGMTELARAGLNVDQVMQALPHTLNLAIGGNLALAESSDIVTNIMAQMSIGFEDTQRTVDVLQKTASTSNSTIQSLGVSYSYVGSIARDAGVKFEVTAGMLGLLHSNGIKADRAGTGLRQVFTQIIDPTTKASQALKELGINTKDPVEVIDQLSKKGKDAEAVLLKFGLVAGPSLRALVSSGADAIREYVEVLNNAEGTSQKAADIMSDNLQGAITNLESAWDALGRTLTKPLLGPLSDEARDLATTFRETAKSEDFQQFADDVSESVLALTTVIKAVIEGAIEFKEVIFLVGKALAVFSAVKFLLFLTQGTAGFVGLTVATKGAATGLAAVGTTSKGAAVSMGVAAGSARTASLAFLGLATAVRAIPGAVIITAAVLGVEQVIKAFNRIKEVNKVIEDAEEKNKRLTEDATKAYEKLRIKAEEVTLAYRNYRNEAIPTQEKINSLTLDQANILRATLEKSAAYWKAEGQVRRLSKESWIEERKQLKFYEKALDDITTQMGGLNKAAAKMGTILSNEAFKITQAFQIARDSGKTVAQSLEQITKSINVDQGVQSIKDLGTALNELGNTGQTSAEQINNALESTFQNFTSNELLAFSQKLSTAFDGFQNQAELTDLFLRTTLSSSLSALEIDAIKATKGISTAGEQAITQLEIVIASAAGNIDLITQAFSKVIDETIQTEVGIKRLGDLFFRTFDNASLGANQVAATLEKLNQKEEELIGTTDKLKSAYATLGIKSQAELDAAAESARQAFETIRKDGTASIEIIAAAFVAYKEKAVEANHNIVDTNFEVEASFLGITDKINEFGSTAIQAGEETTEAFKEVKESVESIGIKVDETAVETKESFKKVEESVENVGAKIDETAGSIQKIPLGLSLAYQEFADVSDKALVKFEENIAQFNGRFTGSVQAWFNMLNAATEQTRRLVESEVRAFSNIESRLKSLEGLTAREANQLLRIVNGFKVIDDSDLSKIRGQIENLREQTQALNETISDTLSSLQDELDRLKDNDAAIEARRYAQEQLKIQKLISDAKASSDAKAIASAKEALKIAAKIHEYKIADIKAEKQSTDARLTRETVARETKAEERSTVMPNTGIATNDYLPEKIKLYEINIRNDTKNIPVFFESENDAQEFLDTIQSDKEIT